MTAITNAQREVLEALVRSGKRMETNAVSRAAGHRYSPWAYEKLKSLSTRGLVLRNDADRSSLMTWQISDRGRAALASATEARRAET